MLFIVSDFTDKYLSHCCKMPLNCQNPPKVFCRYHDITRMHSSRMRTVSSSSHLLTGGGVCLSACWDLPNLGLDTPLSVGLETPLARPPTSPCVLVWKTPSQTPQHPPWVWAWRPPSQTPQNVCRLFADICRGCSTSITIILSLNFP